MHHVNLGIFRGEVFNHSLLQPGQQAAYQSTAEYSSWASSQPVHCFLRSHGSLSLARPNLIHEVVLFVRYKSIITQTMRHLHERCDEHKLNSSSIKKHFINKHDCLPDNFNDQFKVLRKCKTKYDCLIYEMLFIRDLSPSLNVQSDSIKAKLFK